MPYAVFGILVIDVDSSRFVVSRLVSIGCIFLFLFMSLNLTLNLHVFYNITPKSHVLSEYDSVREVLQNKKEEN
jgi:hypothetical protein